MTHLGKKHAVHVVIALCWKDFKCVLILNQTAVNFEVKNTLKFYI